MGLKPYVETIAWDRGDRERRKSFNLKDISLRLVDVTRDQNAGLNFAQRIIIAIHDTTGH